MTSILKTNRVALALFAGAALVTALILAMAPPEREVSSLGAFIVKLVPFVLATEAIARLQLDRRERSLLFRAALPLCFVAYFCYFVPKIFFYLDDFPKAYVTILTLTPFLILTFVMAFRLGGGSAESTRRSAYGLLLLMLSGIEDLAFLTVNDHTEPELQSIPERWTWASHMKVRLGHYPTKYEAFAFIAVHVALALVVLFAPVPRRWRRTPAATGAAGTVEAAPGAGGPAAGGAVAGTPAGAGSAPVATAPAPAAVATTVAATAGGNGAAHQDPVGVDRADGDRLVDVAGATDQ